MTNIHMQSLVIYYFLYYITLHQIIKHRTVTLANHIIHLGKRNASKVLKENMKERGNIKMDFIEITYDSVDWATLTQDQDK